MFDLEKAIYCTKKLKDYFSGVEQDANVEVPKSLKIGSNNYIIYIFYSCLLDYGMRSKVYHNNLINTYNNYPNLFDPKYIVDKYKNNEDELYKIIKENIHPRYPSVALKKWLELSNYLNNHYSDKTLKNKITTLKSYKELYDFIINIKGYGQKTGGLLLRLISESGICDFNDKIKNIPIDRHDIEISYLNGVVKKTKLTNKEIDKLGIIWIEAASKNNIEASDIDKYLWSIGNNLCTKKQCTNCPLNTNCKKKEDI